MEEVTDPVVFSVSNCVSYINGIELTVDGGYSVNAG